MSKIIFAKGPDAIFALDFMKLKKNEFFNMPSELSLSLQNLTNFSISLESFVVPFKKHSKPFVYFNLFMVK